MKKLDNVYENMTSFSSLCSAFYRASKGRRFRSNVAKYRVNLESNIFALEEKLKNKTYTFGPYLGFYVFEPKTRYIESAIFENRIVHHAVFECLETWLDPILYEHSYACRTGRGTHLAMTTLKGWLRNKKLKYYIKCDVKKFFPSIDRRILIKLLHKKIADKDLLALLENLILSSPSTNGIPIGNLTSQLFANLYLNELDGYVKRELRVKHYIRYMDDFILLVETKEEMQLFFTMIENFLKEKLNLLLSPQKNRLDKIERGITFVGYFIKRDSIRLKSSGLKRIKKKVIKALHESKISYPLDIKLKKVKHSKFYASYSSFKGQCLLTSYSNVLNETLLEKINQELLFYASARPAVGGQLE